MSTFIMIEFVANSLITTVSGGKKLPARIQDPQLQTDQTIDIFLPIHSNVDTFDVYITRNRERIYLIDFNPFAQKTDALLFDWSELLLAEKRMPMRLLASEAASQHMQQPFAFNRYPSDVTDLSNGQTVAEFAEAFYKKVQTAAK